MKFPLSMLRDFVDTQLNAEQIGDLLTMAGFELEGIEQFGEEAVLDIKVVSNRGDGLSVFGLSREILAKDLEAKPTELYNRAKDRFSDVQVTEYIDIPPTTASIESEFCRRFSVRKFEGVNAASSSPDWMQSRLEACGMRPISLLVDLTNYVMLELGQPLHAFDFDLLAESRIRVRHATPGEKLTTLNGIEHDLDGQMMICDGVKPVGVPGVMGGLETEVADATTNVLLESANFVNNTVRKTRKQLGLNTEASYRFERSVDPDGVVAATQRFTELLLLSDPAVKISNVIDHYPGKSSFAPVRVRPSRASMLLGMEITPEQAQNYLERLGMDVKPEGDDLIVAPPSWRPDIVREEDLIEELGRVHGYEKIPEAMPSGSTPLGGPQGRELIKDRLRESLLRSGFSQMISHSLRSEHPLDEPCERVAPRNPASPEHNILRSSLLPGLAEAARRNGSKNLHIFEMGKAFYNWQGEYGETTYVALLSQGNLLPPNRQNELVPTADFFTLKSTLEDLFITLGIQNQLTFETLEDTDDRFHPTRTARIMTNSREFVGTIGQIHPGIANEIGLESDTIIAELAWDYLIDECKPELGIKSISRNPASRRDIAILIHKSIPYAQIEAAISKAGGEVLEKHWLFDVFEGKGVPEGSHSLGIGMQFRKMGANFTDEEANQVRDAIVAELGTLGAILR
jgi:phenylalanyl-tRNA synthetase beta chain